MLRFRKLELDGYKSWGHPGISIRLDGGGVCQIAGKNGSGKTNIVEGFLWVLTGEQIKQGLKVAHVVNWRHRRLGARGAVEFELGDDAWRVERHRGHPRHANALHLYKNGQRVESENPEEELRRTIGLTHDELLGSVVFSAEDFRNFAEMKPDKRREFIEHLFGLDRFDRASEIAVERRREVKRRINEGELRSQDALRAVADERGRLRNEEEDEARWAREHEAEVAGLRRSIAEDEAVDVAAVLAAWAAVESARREVEEAGSRRREAEAEERARAEALAAIPEPMSEEAAAEASAWNDERDRRAAALEDAKAAESRARERWAAAIDAARTAAESAAREEAEAKQVLAAANGSSHIAGERVRGAEDTVARVKEAAASLIRRDADLAVELAAVGDATCPQCGQKLPPDLEAKERAKVEEKIAKNRTAMGEASEAIRRSSQALDEARAAQEAADRDSEKWRFRHAGALETSQAAQGKLAEAREDSKREIGIAAGAVERAEAALAEYPHGGRPSRDAVAAARESASARAQAALARDKAREAALARKGEHEAAAGRLAALEAPGMGRDEAVAAGERLRSNKALLEAAGRRENPGRARVEDALRRVAAAEGRRADAERALGDDRVALSYAEALAQGFGKDMRVAVLQQMVPIFNGFIREYMGFLLPNASLEFDADLACRLSFEGVDVEDPRQLNTGSRARINIAVALATHAAIRHVRRAATTSVVFYDEVLDVGLDDEGESAAMSLLRSMPQTVFVISHRASLADEFDRSLTAHRDASGDSVLVDSTACGAAEDDG